MIRMYYHLRVPDDREEEAEAKLKEWVNRMVGAKGFKGAVILEEFHHFAGGAGHKFHAFAMNHDWDAKEDFSAFWAANGKHYPVPSGHPWLAHFQEGEEGHGHAHAHGEEHEHDEGGELFEEQFHGHYEIVYQVA